MPLGLVAIGVVLLAALLLHSVWLLQNHDNDWYLDVDRRRDRT